MPQSVTRIVTANHLNKGDKILAVGELRGHILCGRNVVSAETKTKLTHIVASNGVAQKSAVPWTTSITVSREEPTDEERAARDREISLLHIHEAIKTAGTAVEEARAKLNSDLVYASTYWCNRAADLAETQEKAFIWKQVVRAAEKGIYRDASFEVGDLIAAVRAVAAEIREEAMNRHPNSRSTSVIHNAFEDVVLAARLAWVRSLAYFIR